MHAPEHALAYCEDQTFWDFEDARGKVVDRKVIVSCDRNRKNWNTVMGPLRNPNPRGALWLVDFDKKKAGIPRKILFEGYPNSKDFHPLGVEIWPSVSGNDSNMFVVNHARDKSTIEQFVLNPSHPTTAKYIRTISSKYLLSPNSLALTSPTSFFVSNDHLMTRRLPSIFGKTLPVIESFLALPLGFIVHVTIVHDAVPGAAIIRHTLPQLGIPFANGISLSPDKKTLAVASSSLGAVQFYNRTISNQTSRESLQFLHSVPLPFAPDNVAYDSNGSLMVAGHPAFFSLTKVAADHAGAISPSWVVSLDSRQDATLSTTKYDMDAPYPSSKRAGVVKGYDVETVYQGNGTKFGSSTTGLRDARTGTVFVTGLYEDGLLVCRP